MRCMGRRKHFTVYWDEQEDGPLMEILERIARKEKRSKSATALIALREYVMKYLSEEPEPAPSEPAEVKSGLPDGGDRQGE